MIVELVEEEIDFGPSCFQLLNGIALLAGDDEKLVAVDGGANSVCLIARDPKKNKKIGRLGYGRYAFREPVGVFAADGERVFVTDWHNHRVVQYDANLNYVTEIGCASWNSSGKSRSILWDFFKFLANKGSYIQSHFGTEQVRRYSGEIPGRSIGMALEVLRYYIQISGGLCSAIKGFRDSKSLTSKPNGVCSIGKALFVTQKNTKSVNIYEEVDGRYNLIDVIYGPNDEIRFGRLGNICAFENFLYICDEQLGAVWEVEWPSRRLRKVVGECSGIGNFAPFAACVINNDFLAVCGGLNIQIFSLKTLELVDKSHNIGELHAITYSSSKNRIYVADRGTGKIRVLKWDCNGNE